MKNKDLSDAEKWRTHQATVLLESLCVEIEHIVDLEDEGVKLILEGNHGVMECKKCKERWEVDTITLRKGRIKIRGFIQHGMGYRFSCECPNGCNKNSKWKENICWSSILKNDD